MKLSEVAELFIIIKRYYPSFDASTENTKRFEKYLRDIPFETAKQNLDQHIMTDRFPPTIADLRGSVAVDTDRQRMKDETSSYFSQIEFWRQNAAPPPEGMKEHIRDILRGNES